MRRARLAVVVALALLPILVACGKTATLAAPADGERLFGSAHDPWTVAPVALADAQTGAKVTIADDTTKPLTLVFFGYTNCPDLCPIVMSALASAMTRLSEQDRDDVQVVFITTDPSRDTPAVLKSYLTHYDPAFRGLTGSLDDLQRLALSFKVNLFGGTKLPSGGYDVTTHDTHVTAVDGKTHTTSVLWDSSTSSAQFAYDIHQILKDGQ